MAVYALTGDERYRRYVLEWAQRHRYALLGTSRTRNADNQNAGQAYLDLVEVGRGQGENPGEDQGEDPAEDAEEPPQEPSPTALVALTASVDAMARSRTRDDWWWVDALHMAMPVFARLGVRADEPSYPRAMYELYHHTKYVEGGRGLYDRERHLWWRDKRFVGGPTYWSRGNGWAFAAHAKVLAVLPRSDPHYAEYAETFRAMAGALAKAQRDDGFWNVDLGNPRGHRGPETSGTAFFTFGFAWGVKAGLLDRGTYLPVVARGWQALADTALQPDGTVGYVQPTASGPADGPPVTRTSTQDFGVGAFSMAAAAVADLAPARR